MSETRCRFSGKIGRCDKIADWIATSSAGNQYGVCDKHAESVSHIWQMVPLWPSNFFLVGTKDE